MTKPIVCYTGNTGFSGGEKVPSAWYINGNRVAVNVGEGEFLREFVEYRYTNDHIEGSAIAETLDEVDEFAKLHKQRYLSEMIAKRQAEIDSYQTQLDSLS